MNLIKRHSENKILYDTTMKYHGFHFVNGFYFIFHQEKDVIFFFEQLDMLSSA
jgi:hypothetical protein